VENLDAIECGVVGVFIAPTTKNGRWKWAVVWRTRQSGAPPDTVRCTSHVSRPLGFDRWSSVLWARLAVRCATRACSVLCVRRRAFNVLQSTVAREVVVAPLAHRTVRCAPDSPVNFSGADSRSWRVQSRSPLGHRTLSGGAPDSPVNYSEASLRIPKGEKFSLESPGAPDTVRWHTGQSGAPDQRALRLSLALFV
jgi:hypothetical protein